MCDVSLVDLDTRFLVHISHHVSIIEEILSDQAAREGNILTFENSACQTQVSDFAAQFANRQHWVTFFTDVSCG